MAKATEKDVLIPALKVIKKHPGCDMTLIIKEIEKEMTFSPEDLEPLANRNDLKYSQIIRNLNSHYENGNDFSKYVNRVFDGRRYTYSLNKEGEKLLVSLKLSNLAEEMAENLEDWDVKEAKAYDSDIDLKEQNNRQPTINEESLSNHRYKTDPRISQSVLKKANYQCEYAKMLGLNHKTFNAKRGHFYTEAHHLIPMKAQKDFPGKNLDREENIVSLCPNCHCQVHYGTLDEKIKILKPLYEARIEVLRNCEHEIDISFEDLINLYYL